MKRLLRFAVRSPAALLFVSVLVSALVVGTIVVGLRPDEPAAPPAAAAAGEAGGFDEAIPQGQARECSRVGTGFARAFFDASASDVKWRTNVQSWLAPDVADLFARVDRSRVPVWSVTGPGAVAAQPGSCDVQVPTTGGVLPVVVESRPDGWVVTSWG